MPHTNAYSSTQAKQAVSPARLMVRRALFILAALILVFVGATKIYAVVQNNELGATSLLPGFFGALGGLIATYFISRHNKEQEDSNHNNSDDPSSNNNTANTDEGPFANVPLAPHPSQAALGGSELPGESPSRSDKLANILAGRLMQDIPPQQLSASKAWFETLAQARAQNEVEDEDTYHNSSNPAANTQTAGNNGQEAPQDDFLPEETPISELLAPLIGLDDGLEVLRMLVGDIQTREATQEEDFNPPSNLELMLVQQLIAAGVLQTKDHDAVVRIVRPSRSMMYYLRNESENLSPENAQRVLAIEAAINRCYLLSRSLVREGKTENLSMTELLHEYSKVQAGAHFQPIAALVDKGNPRKLTEADVRGEIASQIESWILPYRLVAQFRCNVSAGIVSFTFTYTPHELLPEQLYIPSLGSSVPATPYVLKREAARYNAQVALLLAAGAFASSSAISQVRVAALQDTSQNPLTLMSMAATREQFLPVYHDELLDPLEALRQLNGNFEFDPDNNISCSEPFVLDAPDVCPSERYQPLELSLRALTPEQAKELGATHVSDLGIFESAKREEIAKAAGRYMDGTTETAVRVLLELSREYADKNINYAANKVVQELIDGTLSSTDTPTILERFVESDPLTEEIKAMSKDGVIELTGDWDTLPLGATLAAIDADKTYENSESVRWQSFRNYTERVLYNLSHTPDEVRRTKLVPDSYYETHLMAANAYASVNDAENTYKHAQRCLELNPYDGRVHMLLVNMYQFEERDEDALIQIKKFLDSTYSQLGFSHAYHAMSHLQYRLKNYKLAEAAMRKCIEFSTPLAHYGNLELSAYLSSHTPYFADAPEGTEAYERALREAGIPVAPSPGLIDKILSARNQALNAEIFPVARNLAMTVAVLTNDDVSYGIAHSIESEPDR